MARSRSRMRPKSVARIFAPHPGPREPLVSHRDDQPLLRMQTLGAARLQLGYGRLGLSAGMLLPLVVRLVYTPGLSVERETLLRELWPRHEGERRRGNLRQALYKLRTMGLQVSLEGELVQLDPAQVLPMFCVDRTIPLFERDIIRGAEPLGPFVPGLVPPSEEMSEWLERTRATVHADVRRVLVEQLRSRRERADWTGAEVLSRWLLPFDPLNEDATLTLAECAMLNGSKAEAVAILDRYLAELGPNAGEIRLPATQLRKRFTDPGARRKPSLALTERHFVGREQELSELTLAMRRARWHDGSAILLHGPPGIGKTRLLTELSKVAQIEGYREIALDCRESDQRRPLGVFLDAIPELLEVPGALGCSPESLGVLRRLLGAQIAIPRESLLESEESTDTTPVEIEEKRYVLPPERARVRSIRHALVDLIGAISEERPVFFAIEDIHWSDLDSWECIADLAQRSPGMRVFLIGTSRSRHALVSRPARFPNALITRELDSLSDQSSLDLARKIGEDCAASLTSAIEDWFVEAGEGSPLMIRSLVHHWVETGVAGGVPPSLQVLLEQRIERLHEHALRTMQVIALLGNFATPIRIQALLQLPNHELLNALEQLTLSGCLKQTDEVFFVAHELIGGAAIERLPRLLRTTLHSAVADLLIAEHREQPNIELLLNAIEHLVESFRSEEAVRLLCSNTDELIGLGWPSRILRAIERSQERNEHHVLRSSLLRLKSRLELELGEYGRSLTSSPSGVTFPAEITQASSETLDEALSAIDSASRSDPLADRNELTELATQIATDMTVSPRVRLRAAEIALVLAANTCNSLIAQRCFTSCQGLLASASNNEGLERSSLLYHTVFGDLATAKALALSYLNTVRKVELSTSVVQDIGRAAFALRMCGELDTCKEAFSLALVAAKALDAPRLAEYPAWQLAQIAIDEGDRESLANWNIELRQLLSTDSDPVASAFAAAHFCRDAILRSDSSAALLELDCVKASLPRIPTPKASAYVVALELGIGLLQPRWIPSVDLVEAGLEKHKQTAAFGTSDFLTTVVAEGLIRLRRKVRAEELIEEYLSSTRRERFAPSRSLIATQKRASR